jgi:hypothetical protein
LPLLFLSITSRRIRVCKNSYRKSLCAVRYAALLASAPEAKIQIRFAKLKPNKSQIRFKRRAAATVYIKGKTFSCRATRPYYSATDGYVWRIGENKLGEIRFGFWARADEFITTSPGKLCARIKSRRLRNTETVLGFVGTPAMQKELHRICILEFIPKAAR